jgi:hypothetical protein
MHAPGGRRRLGIPWRTAIREFLVILAGVLGALGAQAWWQGQQDAGREHDYLRQLLADTRENERRLDEAIREDSLSGLAIARLANILYGTMPVPVGDSLRAAFAGSLFSTSDFQPLSGTYTALSASGDLRLIHTDTLRAQLVAYDARLENERQKLAFFLEQAYREPGRVMRALPFMRDDMAQRQWRRRPPSAIDIAALRANPELAAMLFPILVANANRLSHLRGLRVHTIRLRRTLEADAGMPPAMTR